MKENIGFTHKLDHKHEINQRSVSGSNKKFSVLSATCTGNLDHEQ